MVTAARTRKQTERSWHEPMTSAKRQCKTRSRRLTGRKRSRAAAAALDANAEGHILGEQSVEACEKGKAGMTQAGGSASEGVTRVIGSAEAVLQVALECARAGAVALTGGDTRRSARSETWRADSSGRITSS